MNKKIYFPREREKETAAFEEAPILAVFEFLSHFDAEGQQITQVFPHILEFLARRFSEFCNNSVPSLDKAFGGATTRQRNKILRSDQVYEVAFLMSQNIKEIKRLSPAERAKIGAGTPYELAISKTADELGISEDSTHLLYVKSKSR